MKPPEQQEADAQAHAAAQEWVREYTGWVELSPITKTELWLCEANDCKRAFLAGHAAGRQDERSRIWAECEKRDGTLLKEWRLGDIERIIFGDEKL